MRFHALCLCCLALAAAPAAGGELPSWGALTANNVRVRSGRDLAFREMCTLPVGHIVRVLEASEDGEWYRLVPPPEGDVYIFAEFVREQDGRGTVTGNRVNVRVRPDLTGEVVDQLDEDATVTIKEKVDGEDGEWYKIEPPDTARAWISARHVDLMTDEELAEFREKKAEEARQAAERAQRERDEARLVRVDDWVRKNPEDYEGALARCREALREIEHPEVREKLETLRDTVRARQEEAERRREEERKARERALLTDADAAFERELKKGLPDRALDAVIENYREVLEKLTEEPLKQKARAQTAVATDMRAIQAAMAAKADPPEPSDFDFDEAAETFDMEREVRALSEARRLAERTAEEERKAQERAALAEADAVFHREMKKELADRDFGAVVASYRAALETLTEEPLRQEAEAKSAFAGEIMANLQAALERADPPPPPDFDFDEAAELFDLRAEVQALGEARRLAERTAAEERARPTTAEGWIAYLGAGLADTGASHRVTRGGAVVALVKSERLDLGSFIGVRLRISGSPAGTATVAGEEVPIIDVETLEPALETIAPD